MEIGFCQFDPLFGQVERNLEKAGKIIREAKADILVLPELFATGYQFVDRKETAGFAEGIDGPTISWARALANEKKIILCGGFAEAEGDRIYNSAFCAGPLGNLGIYRKIHLFSREKECFDPGDRGFPVFECMGVNVGLIICFDWIFPESIRQLALAGAQVICHPANLVLPYCQEAMKTRCLENGVFAVTANRTGTDARIEGEELIFTGKSQVTGPMGEVLCRATEEFTGVQSVSVELDLANDKSVNPYNDRFKDRKPEFYSLITRRSK